MSVNCVVNIYIFIFIKCIEQNIQMKLIKILIDQGLVVKALRCAVSTTL